MFLYKQFDIAIKKDEFQPVTPFAKAYGVKGAYFSDLEEDINSSPLVIIQSKDLAELVAAKHLADYWADYEGYNPEAIRKKAKEISKTYLMENGMSEDDYNFFEELER
jgi:hypothetical protein